MLKISCCCNINTIFIWTPRLRLSRRLLSRSRCSWCMFWIVTWVMRYGGAAWAHPCSDWVSYWWWGLCFTICGRKYYACLYICLHTCFHADLFAYAHKELQLHPMRPLCSQSRPSVRWQTLLALQEVIIMSFSVYIGFQSFTQRANNQYGELWKCWGPEARA